MDNWECRDTGWFSSQPSCDQAAQRSNIFYLSKGWHTVNIEGYAIRFGTNPSYWVNGMINVVAFPEYTGIKVNYPNGGENWVRTTKTITWTSFGKSGDYVKIELYKGGVLSSNLNAVIASKTPNDGSYDWYIPTYQPIGEDYKIKIISNMDSTYTNFRIS